MKRLKEILYRLLYPNIVLIVLSVPVSAALLAYTFLAAGENSPVACVSYVFSAYSLTVVCFNVVPVVKKVRQWLFQNPYISRFFEDIPFRLRITLHLSVGINLLYAGVNAFSGIYYRSPWFGSLAAYYIFLSVMRFLLVRYAHKQGFGENKSAEWRRYRLCGVILTMMHVALAGVVILVIRQNRGFEYAGSLIYVMALYAFYITITGVINVVRYRKYNSPVMSAARVVSLVAAMVSMLSLETAMLTQFDSGDNPPLFRQIMVGFTGGSVCAIVVVMGISMIIHSTKQLRK